MGKPREISTASKWFAVSLFWIDPQGNIGMMVLQRLKGLRSHQIRPLYFSPTALGSSREWKTLKMAQTRRRLNMQFPPSTPTRFKHISRHQQEIRIQKRNQSAPRSVHKLQGHAERDDGLSFVVHVLVGFLHQFLAQPKNGKSDSHSV